MMNNQADSRKWLSRDQDEVLVKRKKEKKEEKRRQKGGGTGL